VEITTLVIPGVNDNEECLRDIAGRIRELGDIPWHVILTAPHAASF
jgi:pyruvate formate lyase activating enzyme